MSRRTATPTKVSQLLADDANPRLHSDRNLAAITASLKTLGAARSIVIDERGVVLAGNGVTASAANAGITRVRVIDTAGDEIIAVRRTGLTKKQKKALAVADNRTGELAAWDIERLQLLHAEGLDLSQFWTPVELSDLLSHGVRSGRVDPDAIPEPRTTQIRSGDLFALGRHRLMCGDSRSAATVAALLGGERAQLMITSAPYGVGMEYEGPPEEKVTVALIDAVFTIWAKEVVADGFSFVNFGERYVWSVPMAAVYHDIFKRLGWRWYDLRVWKRSNVGMAIWNTTQPRAMSQIEQLFTFQNGSGKYPVHDLGISKDQLWDDAGSSAEFDHPAVMAAGVARKAALIYSAADDLIIDPFGGAGTTLIAAEQTSRRSAVMEIEPKYCQVIVDRWEAFSGEKVKRLTPRRRNHG